MRSTIIIIEFNGIHTDSRSLLVNYFIRSLQLNVAWFWVSRLRVSIYVKWYLCLLEHMPPYVILRVCITLSRALKSIGIGLLYPLGVKDTFPELYYVLCCSLIWHVSIGLLSVDTHLYCVFSGWRNQATNLVVILIVIELAILDCLDLLFALEFYIFSIWILPNYTKNIVLFVLSFSW